MLRALSIAAIGIALLPSTAMAMDWDGFYAQVYGGSRLAAQTTYYDTHIVYDMLAGPSFGASVGIGTPVEGFTVDLDLMHTSAPYVIAPEQSLRTTTLMIDGVFSAPLGDMFTIYGGAGLGVMNITWDDGFGTSTTGTGPAYQLKAGASVAVSDNVSILTEFKYQNSFGYIVVTGDSDVTSPTYNALVGVRFTPN